METPLWFLFITLGIPLLYLLHKLFSLSQNGRLPPGPSPLPIIGNLLDLDNQQPHVSLAQLAKTHGPVMSVKFGLTTTIVISSPDAARDVFQKHDVSFAARSVPDSFHAYNLDSRSILWLPSTSPLWKQLRAICSTYLFSQRCLDSTREKREMKAHDIMQLLRRNINQPVDIGRVIFSGILNILSNVLFSEDVIDADSESPQEFKELIAEFINEILIKPNVSDFFPFLSMLDLQGRRRSVEGYLKRFFDFFDNVINRRVTGENASAERDKDFLDSLLELNAESKLDRQAIKVLLMEMFVAGSDTSSITVEWALAELLHNPVALAKAQSEVRRTFPSKDHLKELDIAKLPYIQAVVKEAMRLHPAGPLLLPHKAIQGGLELGGFKVPKEARVLINVWAIGRNPKVWDEPDVFRPERFLEKEFDFRGKNTEFTPFGSGRRTCPGLPFATKVVPYLLALLLREFDWKLPHGMEPKDMDLTEKFLATLELATPLHVIPVPRAN